MMSMSYHSCHDSCLVSDAVFDMDQSWFQDTYCPQYNNIHSLDSQADMFNTIFSPRDLPMYSQKEPIQFPSQTICCTYSQEVKNIFDLKFDAHKPRSRSHSQVMMPSAHSQCEQIDPSGNPTEDSYSNIQFSNKNDQRTSSISSHYSYQGQVQNQSQAGRQIYCKSNSPAPPTRTSSSASSQLSLQGDGTQTHKQSVFQSMSSPGFSYSNNYHQSKRKTWSPAELHRGKQEHQQCSYSNEQLLEMPHTDNRDHIYKDQETGPPNLAPISGMLTQSPGNCIVKPIAFKPVVTHKFITPPKQNVEQTRKYFHDDGYGSQDYGVTNQNVASTSRYYGFQDYGVTNQNVANTSHGSQDYEATSQYAVNTSHGSQDSGVTNKNAANTSHGSSHMEFDRSASFTSNFNMTSDRSDSVAAFHFSQLSSNHIDGYILTPSPSDSGIGELEAILKEKDAELNTLRDVMDKNERAIFQVHEEKRNAWVHQIQDIRDEYENKVKHIQRKLYKSEQVFNLQIFKLQQQKKTMKEEIDKLHAEKDDLVQKCVSFAEETNRLKALMNDATWQAQGCRQLGDVSNLQIEIDNLNCKLSAKVDDVLRLTAKLDETKSKSDKAKSNDEMKKCISEELHHEALSECLPRSSYFGLTGNELYQCLCEKEAQTDFTTARFSKMEALKPSLTCEKDREISALRDELDKYHREMLVNKKEYDKEKEQWLEEKNKVIMYQKQLQLNYVQMFRKNKMLEAEVEQLTLELESRDMKLTSLNGEESVC